MPVAYYGRSFDIVLGHFPLKLTETCNKVSTGRKDQSDLINCMYIVELSSTQERLFAKLLSAISIPYSTVFICGLKEGFSKVWWV